MNILGVGNRQPANFKALYPNATDDGVDLLRQLLVIDPEQRISATDALNHNFVNEFLIKLDDNDDCMMESDTRKFDFGFESEVNTKKISLKKAIFMISRNGH
jgi:serine/threonine protein kinase